MKIENLAVAALLTVSLTPFGSAAPGPGPQAPSASVAPMPKTDRMPMAEFKKLLAGNDVVVIDVRSSDSYLAGHIPGALSMPEETLNSAVAEKLKRMGKAVATYCS